MNCKATFVLPVQVMNELKEAVKAGLAPSASELVREAIRLRLRQMREDQLTKTFQKAACDKRFLRDVQDTMQAFENVDSETARMLP